MDDASIHRGGDDSICLGVSKPAGIFYNDRKGIFYLVDAGKSQLWEIEKEGINRTTKVLVNALGTAGSCNEHVPINSCLSSPSQVVSTTDYEDADMITKIFISDTGNHRIQKVIYSSYLGSDDGGYITTIAGSGICDSSTSFQAAATFAISANQCSPTTLAVHGSLLYFIDTKFDHIFYIIDDNLHVLTALTPLISRRSDDSLHTLKYSHSSKQVESVLLYSKTDNIEYTSNHFFPINGIVRNLVGNGHGFLSFIVHLALGCDFFYNFREYRDSDHVLVSLNYSQQALLNGSYDITVTSLERYVTSASKYVEYETTNGLTFVGTKYLFNDPKSKKGD